MSFQGVLPNGSNFEVRYFVLAYCQDIKFGTLVLVYSPKFRPLIPAAPPRLPDSESSIYIFVTTKSLMRFTPI